MHRHIDIDPDIKGGKPRIKGRRITVHDIVIWHERMGLSPDEIASSNDLQLAEIHDALAYYFDNRDTIDKEINKDALYVREIQKKYTSKISQRLKESSSDA